MIAAERPRILCVDDEAGVLEGLEVILGRRFKVETATSRAAGRQVLSRCRDVAVVISDMRMPGMDGAAFLSKVRTVEVRELHPSALRPGMQFAEDVKFTSGARLVARGAEATPSSLARARNFPDGTMPSRIRVIVTPQEKP